MGRGWQVRGADGQEGFRRPAAVIAVALSACSNKPPENRDYGSRLTGDRQARIDSEEDEPVPEGRKPGCCLPTSRSIRLQRPGRAEASPDLNDCSDADADGLAAPADCRYSGPSSRQLPQLTASVDADAANLDHHRQSPTTSGSKRIRGRHIDWIETSVLARLQPCLQPALLLQRGYECHTCLGEPPESCDSCRRTAQV